jgi:hypothetical protein
MKHIDETYIEVIDVEYEVRYSSYIEGYYNHSYKYRSDRCKLRYLSWAGQVLGVF